MQAMLSCGRVWLQGHWGRVLNGTAPHLQPSAAHIIRVFRLQNEPGITGSAKQMFARSVLVTSW
jgi:hypothetical protein